MRTRVLTGERSPISRLKVRSFMRSPWLAGVANGSYHSYDQNPGMGHSFSWKQQVLHLQMQTPDLSLAGQLELDLSRKVEAIQLDFLWSISTC